MSEFKETELLQLIQETDLALVQMEQARSAVDHAKFSLEQAKEDFERSREMYEQVITKADDLDIPRAKLKKLAEERSAALMASGLLSTAANHSKSTKPPKTPKKQKEPKAPVIAEPAAEIGQEVVLN